MRKMKLLLGCIVCFCIAADVAAAPVSFQIEEPSSWSVKLSEIVKLSPRDFQKITGKKMKLREKIAFFLAKNKMKRWLKKNGDMVFSDYLRTRNNEDRKFSFLWFAVGLLSITLAVPLILLLGSAALIITPLAGIALVYGTKQDRTEKGSFWFGFGLGAICFLLLFFIALANMSFDFG